MAIIKSFVVSIMVCTALSAAMALPKANEYKSSDW